MTKVTLRNLAAHKLRLVLTALSVILGVAFVAGTLTFTDTVTKSFDDLVGSFGKNTSAVVRAKKVLEGEGQGDFKTGVVIPQATVDTVSRLAGVQTVWPQVQGYAAIIDKDNKLVGGGGPPQFGLNWTEDGDRSITEGRTPNAPSEVALDTKTAKKAGYKLGDQVKIQFLGSIQPFTVVGIVGGNNLGATLTYFDTATAQKLLLKPGEFSSISVKAKDGVNEQQVVDQIKPVLPAQLEAVTGEKIREENKQSFDEFLSFMRPFLLAFAFVSIIVGSFNIFNTFSMLVAQRTRELALLRAVGASRRQVTRAVLGEAVAVGLVGSTLGLGLGLGLAALLKTIFGSFGLELGGGLSVTPMTVVAAYLVGIVVTCVAAYFPARRAAKIPPVAAMRDDVGIPQRSLRIRAVIGSVVAVAGAALMSLALSGNAGNTQETLSILGLGVLLVWLAAAMLAAVIGKPVVRFLAGYYPKVFGVAGRMAKENPGRNPRRTAVTAVALMIGLSLVTTVNVIGSSLSASIADTVGKEFGVDYTVASSNANVPLNKDLISQVEKLKDVDKAVEIGLGTFKSGKDNHGYATGNPAELLSVVNSKVIAGTSDTGADGVLLSEDQAESDKLTVGSVFPAIFPDGKTENLTVKGIYPKSQLLGSVVLSPDVWKAHTTDPLPFMVAVKTSKAGDDFRKSLDAVAKPFPGVDVQDQSDLKQQVQSALNLATTFFTMMLALSIIIAVFGVINTIVLSVTERTRELGLLRAVGLSRRQMRRMVRLESVAIALFGGLLGVGLGLGFGIAIQHSSGDNMQVLAIPYFWVVFWIVFSVVIGILASLWPAWRAGKMDILKAIATQ
ncbi:ABC transporter permease [Actinocorallia longicatena]|uniref:ABC transporter permease n=1 Tax=Actinocorallia longicatena TaxID=111803 RepID=A0ABP6Q4B2_9ACTN